MKAILNNWTIVRGLRLLIGLIALIQSVNQKDTTLGILGFFVLFTTVANVGCCGRNVCALNFRNLKKQKEATYEELDSQE